MKLTTILLAGVAMLAATEAQAQSVTSASGSGWCLSGGYCDNTSTTSIENHFAGSDGDTFHNWFAFQLPTGTFSSASLSIWNDGRNLSGGGVYDLYAANSIDYEGLVAGDVLGTISEASADTGVSHYVDISLNNAGLAALNGSAGKSFVFGGANSGYQLFGYTGGTPIAQLTTTAGAGAVPEPATWAMMMLGMGAIGYSLRRRSKVNTSVRFA